MSKKACPIIYNKLLYKIGQDFLKNRHSDTDSQSWYKILKYALYCVTVCVFKINAGAIHAKPQTFIILVGV